MDLKKEFDYAVLYCKYNALKYGKDLSKYKIRCEKGEYEDEYINRADQCNKQEIKEDGTK